MRDLPAMLMLAALALLLPCQADAACDSDPLTAELCDCYAEQEQLAVDLAECRLLRREDEREREAMRGVIASQAESIQRAEADLARERARKRAWRTATPVAGGVGVIVGAVLVVAVLL